MGKTAEKKLTDKESRFVQEYLIDLNATQAAIRAKYSQKTAGSIGKENLQKPHLKKAIQKAQREIEERTKVTVDKVLKGIALIAFPAPDRETADRDRLKALDMAGKHLGMFTEKHEHSGEVIFNVKKTVITSKVEG